MKPIIGAVAICKIDDKYLMLKHKDGFWSFPGGKIEDKDATIIAGLEREIKEETGLNRNSFELKNSGEINKFIYSSEKPNRAGKSGETHYFLMTLKEKVQIHPHSEIRYVGWFTKDEVMEKLFNKDMQAYFTKITSRELKLQTKS